MKEVLKNRAFGVDINITHNMSGVTMRLCNYEIEIEIEH